LRKDIDISGVVVQVQRRGKERRGKERRGKERRGKERRGNTHELVS
jgi:hypothetical protein